MTPLPSLSPDVIVTDAAVDLLVDAAEEFHRLGNLENREVAKGNEGELGLRVALNILFLLGELAAVAGRLVFEPWSAKPCLVRLVSFSQSKMTRLGRLTYAFIPCVVTISIFFSIQSFSNRDSKYSRIAASASVFLSTGTRFHGLVD